MADPLKLLRGLLVTELGLAADRAFVYNSKWNIPPDDGLFALVSFERAKPYSTSLWYEDTPAGLTEVQETAVQETYAIDLFSRSTEARDRRHEVVFALNSTAAQQMCEANAMKLSDIPSSFLDLSQVEASARLNRFQLTFNVLRLQRREKVAPYYNQFTDPTFLVEP